MAPPDDQPRFPDGPQMALPSLGGTQHHRVVLARPQVQAGRQRRRGSRGSRRSGVVLSPLQRSNRGGRYAKEFFEGRAERSEALVADESGNVADGVPPGVDQTPGFLEPPGPDVGMRSRSRVTPELPEESRRTGKGGTRDHRQRQLREKI